MFNSKAKTSTPGIPMPAIAVRGAVVVGGIALLYGLYTIIWMAVSAAVGLAVLGAIALGGFAVLSALPLLGQYLENLVLKMRKAAARSNPVEQLQNYLILRTKQVEGQKDAAKVMLTQIRSMEQMIEQRRTQKKDIKQNESALGAMKQALQQKIAKIKVYDDGLIKLKDQIEDVEFQQKFAGAVAKAKAAGGSAEDDATNSMLAQEAITSSNDDFNQIFADLDVDTATLNDAKQIEYVPGVTIDLTPIKVPELARS